MARVLVATPTSSQRVNGLLLENKHHDEIVLLKGEISADFHTAPTLAPALLLST